MKIRVHGKDYEIEVKEMYAKHQTKGIQFVMTRGVLVFQGEMAGVSNTWVIRDHKTGIQITTGRTIKETENKLFKMLEYKSFTAFHFLTVRNKPVLNQEETLCQ